MLRSLARPLARKPFLLLLSQNFNTTVPHRRSIAKPKHLGFSTPTDTYVPVDPDCKIDGKVATYMDRIYSVTLNQTDVKYGVQ